MTDISRLRGFVKELTHLVDRAGEDEPQLLGDGSALLTPLINNDDWLPDAFCVPHPDKYQQYLLYCDPHERFSVVSFVWGPGQTTPIHDHTVWGLVGVMRGAELCEEYDAQNGTIAKGHSHQLEVGQIDKVSPTIGDVHRVTNALSDKTSLSIHVYGTNIGAVKRHTFAADGTPSEFISGYSSEVVPNLWDLSRVG
ncbi:MAG: cysteine dioxygenase [Gammaproteobacteria bacterium]|nr:cysteine dioxygenase [Gammaproteobacteria bacterium]